MSKLVHCCFKTITRGFSSALYVTGDKAQSNFVVLTPYIDFDEQHKPDLLKSIQARKLPIDLDKIQNCWNFLKMIDDHKTVLEITKTELHNFITKLKTEGSEKNQNEIEKLMLHMKLVKDDLKNVKEYSYGIEENANLAVLSLPNLLHPETPLETELLIHQFLDQPEPINKNHMEIGKLSNMIEYSSPTFYFLKSDASVFEFAVTNYFQSKLLESGLTQFSNADFARSVIVEGCGIDYLDKNRIFTLEGSSSEINRLHVVGGGSLYSFMAYFAKHSVQSTMLPLKLFSMGRKYAPGRGSSDLFDLCQNSVAQIFVACEDLQQMDDMLAGLVQEIIKLYEPLNYHFKLVYVPAENLDIGESLKVSVQMFSNFSQKYVEVGNLCIFDDYLSKRLLFTCGKEKKFVKVIAGEVLNVQKFLGCALENNFVNQAPLLSNMLQNYV